MTSYRLFLLRSMLGRIGRALAYYWVSVRAQVRVWRASLFASLGGLRVGPAVSTAVSATGSALARLPRKLFALLALVGWFLAQLRPYFARVIADRREDRAELRADRRLIAAHRRAASTERRAAAAERRAESAERRTRRRAELAEIKADAGKDLVAGRRHHLAVPAWISRMERPERPQRQFRVPAPRRALLAAAMTMAAVVPAYAVVSGVMSSGDFNGAVPEVAAAPGAAAVPPAAPGIAAPVQPGVTGTPGTSAGIPTAPPVTVSGDTGEFVRTLPPLPTPVPKVPAPRFVVSSPTAPAGGVAIVGSLTNPLSEHQQREARRQAKWEAKLARAERAADKANGK